MPPVPDDGAALLTSAEVGDLLAAATAHVGGTLVGWRLDHLDSRPGHDATATYAATVDWPHGRRPELLGASVRAGGRSRSDERAVVFGDGEREVAVWLHPWDPDLPGLATAVVPERLAALLTAHGVGRGPVRASRLHLELLSYRPRRRAVVRADVDTDEGLVRRFVKVLRPAQQASTLERHRLLRAAGVPAPEVLAATDDGVVVLAEVPGRPLARALFDEAEPCRVEDLVGLLDALPAGLTALPRRTPWVDGVAGYAAMVAAAVPALVDRVERLAGAVTAGLAGRPAGEDPTHGDFHEGQLFVADGRVTGLVDVDTAGPGRRVDDLGCLLAHLSCVQGMSRAQAAGLDRRVRDWLPVLDARVDRPELRLTAAGTALSLATGPHRGQQPGWVEDTAALVGAAERLLADADGSTR